MPSLFEILTGILLMTMQGIALVNQERIMSGLTDLQSAVAALQDFAKTVVAELATLEAAATAATGDDDATVESLAEQVNASIATIKAALPPASAPSAPTPSAAPSA